MNLVVFSRKGISYDDGKSGAISAIFIPAFDQIRRFTDIPQINEANVQARYGQTTQKVLWRQVGASAVVYGLITRSLAERREGVEVYLPQDFVPQDSDVFFLVFGEELIVHGIRSISDDGQENWNLSQLDVHGDVVNTLVEATSERLLEGVPENVCIAVKGSNNLLKEVQKAVQPLNLRAVDFNALNKRKGAKSLYTHRDFSLVMLSFALFSLLVLIGAAAYLLLSILKFDALEHDIAQLEEQIRRVQMDSPLNYIQDPQAVLREMQEPFPEPPSAIIHAASDAAVEFGALQQIMFQNVPVPEFGENAGQIPVEVMLQDFENELLLYQEELAKSALRDRPWVRSIERLPGGRKAMRLLLQVKEPLS